MDQPSPVIHLAFHLMASIGPVCIGKECRLPSKAARYSTWLLNSAPFTPAWKTCKAADVFTALRQINEDYGTTILNIIAGLDEPPQDTKHIGEKCMQSINARERLQTRRHKIGFIYQTFG